MKKTSIWKPLIAVVVFFIIAAVFKIVFVLSADILPPKGVKIMDGAFVLFTSLGVFMFVRWLMEF